MPEPGPAAASQPVPAPVASASVVLPEPGVMQPALQEIPAAAAVEMPPLAVAPMVPEHAPRTPAVATEATPVAAAVLAGAPAVTESAPIVVPNSAVSSTAVGGADGGSAGKVANGQVFHVVADDLGYIDRNALRGGQRQAADELLRFLSANELRFGGMHPREFALVSINDSSDGSARRSVVFRQMVNGVAVRDSTISALADGRAVDVQLYLVDPLSPDFDSRNWVDRNVLQQRARQVLEASGIAFSDELVQRMDFMILPLTGAGSGTVPFAPVYRLHSAQGLLVQLNALSAETMSVASPMAY